MTYAMIREEVEHEPGLMEIAESPRQGFGTAKPLPEAPVRTFAALRLCAGAPARTLPSESSTGEGLGRG
jgi:hypothetical protein